MTQNPSLIFKNRKFRTSLVLSVFALIAFEVSVHAFPLVDLQSVELNHPSEEDQVLEQQKTKLAEFPVRDLSKYPVVRDFLNHHKIYISLTSSPVRFGKLHHVFSTLDLTYVHEILLNLPLTYSRTHEVYDDATLDELRKYPKVRVLRPEVDIGPITKLIPGIEYAKAQNDPEAIVITIDDDTGYGKGIINEVIYELVVKNENKPTVVSGSGQNLSFWNINGVFPNQVAAWPHLVSFVSGAFDYILESYDPEQVLDRTESVDVVEGFGSIGYVVKTVDTDLMRKLVNVDLMKKIAEPHQQRAVRSCFNSDDFVISFTLALSGVDRKMIRTGYSDFRYNKGRTLRQFAYGFGADALHQGAGLGEGVFAQANVTKYNDCYTFLMKITYDETKKAFRSHDEILKVIADIENQK